MSKPATLKQISLALNLSIATVSRALKDHPDVSTETKRKVCELAKVLDYEPNAHAINLKMNSSKEFGIIVPEISNYFYNYFIAAIEEEARRIGYSVIILQSGNDKKQEEENIRKCRKNRVSGLFVSVVGGEEKGDEFQKAEDAGIPVIFFDKVPALMSCNKVCVADAEAATLAAEAIVKRKKKDILALFGDTALSISQVRKAAFSKVITEELPNSNLTFLEAKNSEAAYSKFVKSVRNKRPDVIFCMSDEILAGVMKGVQYLKLAVPADCGIVAISNGFLPQLYYPEITYAETSGFKLGKVAFTRMMACLAGSTFMQTIHLESVLVRGGSL